MLNPISLEAAQFVNRRLDIDEAEPMYQWVAAEAARNPEIIVMATGVQCPECGELFPGTIGKAQLGQHRKANHFNEWQADREAVHAAETIAILKERAPFACDVCKPLQQFGDEATLNLHTRLIHSAPASVNGALPEETREALGRDVIPDPDGRVG